MINKINPVFSKERLKCIKEIEGRHFWFLGRGILIGQLFSEYFKKSCHFILDLGCGTGSAIRNFSGQGFCSVGVDMHMEGLMEICGSIPNSYAVQADAVSLPFKENSFDAATLMDVLEHADERLMLSEVARVLRKGGVILIAVPAFRCLWSYRDVAAGHHRRYNLKQIKTLLVDFDLKVLEARYYQFFLFPLVFVSRLLGRSGRKMRDLEDSPSLVLNRIFLGINNFEVKLGKYIRWPWGTSLMVVCTKE